ncbi:MAG: transposase [Anaerovoracaceae bacterium]
MKKTISDDAIKYIVGRILEKAEDAVKESEKNLSDQFNSGRRLGYYEVLDVLKSELDIQEFDLKSMGIDIDLEKII